jgi:multisubunit Na+/H+ antiporter MnhF subunit
VNVWLAGATVLTFGLVPCGIVVFTRNAMERLLGLEMASIILALIMILVIEGMGNANFYDLPLALALLAFGGGLVFVRFLERWL